MKKNSIIKALATALLLTASVVGVHAVPALPHPIVVTQPDGTTVTIRLRGDERVNWAETTDGYTLLKDTKGYWAFAVLNKSGNLVASDLRYDGTSARAKAQGIKPNLRHSAAQMRKARKKVAQPDMLIDGTFPSTGKRKLLLLLVNYNDTKTTYTKQNFYRMMNQKNYGGIGSFRDYYLEQSYGKLDLDVTVTDWIKLPKPKDTYGPDGAAYMIYDALCQVTDTLDLRQFDNDGDGLLDGLAVIHQGAGQEASGDTRDIWSHSSIIYGQKFNGVSVRRYTIEPEILATTNRMSTIGVICHEFGHALGAPDFYDTDYASSGGEYCGTGIWDLLGSGAWGGNYGTRPTGINAWQKSVWGWLDPKVLDESTVVADMPSADSEPEAYRMETGNPGEYFIMENRQQTSQFDRALPGHGLIVYHVNENIIRDRLVSNDINATYPQGLYTVCSDAGVDPDNQATSFGKVDGEGCPFPGAYDHTVFSDVTIPSAKSIEGRYSYRELRNITDANGKVGFEFVHHAEPQKPIDLIAKALRGDVEVEWQMPETDADEVARYNVYRNNQKIATTETTHYTDVAPEYSGLISYLVDAEYKDGRISHPVSTKIRVPENKVTSLSADVDGNAVSLKWTVDNELTRVNLYNGSSMASTDIYGDVVEYANCYTPADLNTFVGGKITKMSVLPMQGPSELSMKLHVWEGDANGENMTLVSERNVKEFANGQVRELKLTTPVVIKADHTYWLAVECTSNKGVVSPACDMSNLVKGRGNCVLHDGSFVESTEAKGNFYVSGVVTMPSDEAENNYEAAASTTFDAEYDLYFPMAYSVYCDGELVGRTTAHNKTLYNVPLGEHTYMVACYYNGNNESVGVSQSVEITSETTAITMPEAARPTSRFFGIDGVERSRNTSHGVYIVKQGDQVRKVLVP